MGILVLDSRRATLEIISLCKQRGWRSPGLLTSLLVNVSQGAIGEREVVQRIPSEFLVLNGVRRDEVGRLILDVVKRSSSPESIHMTSNLDILVVTALTLEANEVLTYLTKRGKLRHPETSTTYFTGDLAIRAKILKVAVAVTDAGNTSAASETERAIEFLKPTLALFVGVAGGLKDVALGDVVVATSIYDYSSAKESVEMVSPRIKSLPSSHATRQAAQVVVLEGEWTNLANRGSKINRHSIPSVFLKPIAAGNRVIQSRESESAKWIRDTCGDSVAVEMEGYGFLTAAHAHPQIPVAVIRGISDLVDENKTSDNDKDWQPIAANRAAAFAFCLAGELLIPSN